MSKDKKKKGHKKKRVRLSLMGAFYPVFYPSKMGTPLGYRPGSANDSGAKPSSAGGTGSPGAGAGGTGGAGAGGAGAGAGAGGAGAGGASESIRYRPTKARVFYEMRKSLGMLEYFDDAPQVAWGGYSIPNFSAVSMRTGGPVIGGPGFQNSGYGGGGKYDFKRSPGLSFKTELAWRVWENALKIIDMYPNLPIASIMVRAMAKAGAHRGQIDAAEYRLLEMGVQWYLSASGAVSAARDDIHY